MVIEKIQGQIYIYDDELKKVNWLAYGFSTRLFKTNSDDKVEQVRSFARFLMGKEIPIYIGDQVHKDNIQVIDEDGKWGKENVVSPQVFQNVTVFPETDALILKKKNAAIGILTADCLPILIVDVKNKVVALVHSGWKGTLLNIVGKCINKMIETVGTKIEDLKIWIAPAIGVCCYEVGEEVLSQYKGQFDFYDEIIRGRNLDLVKTARLQLKIAGLKDNQIKSADICTKCNSHIFYSHRAGNNKDGRNILLAVIK